MFLLLEDEFGTINLIVPPDVYERHRLTVRSEPLLLAEGRLERLPIAGGAINVFVKRLAAARRARRGRGGRSSRCAERRGGGSRARARRRRPRGRRGRPTGELADFRGVAPAVQSFASGRRR